MPISPAASRAGSTGSLTAVPTGAEETIECGLVLRSIGYSESEIAAMREKGIV